MNARQQQALKEAKKALRTGEGLCQAIKNLAKSRFSQTEIIEVGFNRSTVYRQVGELRKDGPAGDNTRKSGR